MRKKLRMLISSLIITTVFVSAAGITFSSLEVGWLSAGDSQKVQIMLQEDTQELSSGKPTITPGEPMAAKPYLINTGTGDCYVRVKVNIPEYEGVSLFQLGNLRGDVFQQSEFTVSQAQGAAYWEQNGAYYYYRNRVTGDRLSPGALTPALYTAVMLNPAISLYQLESLQGSREIVICAEAADIQNPDVLKAFTTQ